MTDDATVLVGDLIDTALVTMETSEDPQVVEVTITEPEVTVIGSAAVGPRGLSGNAAVQSYVHTQDIPSDTWTIEHNLGFRPAVTVVDSTHRVVEGGVEYVNNETVVASFEAAFGGYAYLS